MDVKDSPRPGTLSYRSSRNDNSLTTAKDIRSRMWVMLKVRMSSVQGEIRRSRSSRNMPRCLVHSSEIFKDAKSQTGDKVR